MFSVPRLVKGTRIIPYDAPLNPGALDVSLLMMIVFHGLCSDVHETSTFTRYIVSYMRHIYVPWVCVYHAIRTGSECRG